MELTERQQLILEGKICPYCGNESNLVDSSVVYGKSYGMIYLCKPCDAYVGTHKSDNTTALGRLANKELREAKKQAHFFFDKIWQLNLLTRNEAYELLSVWMKLPKKFCHIGMFDVKSCESVTEFAKQKLNDNRRLDIDFGVEPVTPYYE